MMARTLRTVVVAAAVVLLIHGRTTVCQAWSLWPFSSDSKAAAPKKPAAKPAAKQPSTFDKIAGGTKSLFTKPAETLGLKKPPPKKPMYATPMFTAPKQQPSKGLFGSMFQPKDPPKADSPKAWIAGQRPEF
jgi:hypothetical protein